jgi:hypothetical protein
LLGPLGHRRAQNEALLDWMNRYVLAETPAASREVPASAASS